MEQPSKQCVACGATYYKRTTVSKAVWARSSCCSRSCTRKKVALANSFKPQGVAKTCVQCSAEYRVKPSHAARSTFCSNRCRAAWVSANRSGPNNPQWSRVEITCVHCNARKAVAKHRAEGGAKYCSAACMKAAEWVRVALACEHCGKVKQVTPSQAKAFRFCSKPCRWAWESAHKTGANNASWRPKIAVRCERCGTVKEVKPSGAISFRYCSKLCRDGNDNPRWRRISLQCAECGVGMEVIPARANRKKYCSKACMAAGYSKLRGPQTGNWRGGSSRLDCQVCGTSFEVFPARGGSAKYCSRECQRVGIKRRITLICEWCGGKREVRKSDSDKRFCSKECYFKQASIEKRKRKVIICSFCGQSKEVHQSSTRKFCSRKCIDRYRSTYLHGPRSPMWQGGPIAASARRRTLYLNALKLELVDREAIIKRDGLICYLCDKMLTDRQATLDHVMPLIRGGSHTADNLRVCCKSCNSRKADRLLDEFFCFLSERPS